MARLDPEWDAFQRESARLSALLGSVGAISPGYRKLIAEMLLLRLSIQLENTLKIIYCKICSGAPYLDGTIANLTDCQRSIKSAIHAMQTKSRLRDRSNLPWNDGSEIRTNIEHIVSANDHCVTIMLNYASYLTEIRSVRNHIAHKNGGSRSKYKNVILRHYGARLNNITPGTLLLSTRPRNGPLIEYYIKTARIMIKDLVKG